MLLLLADERTGCRALELQQRAQHTMRIAPCLVVRRPDMDSCFPGTSTASFYVSRDASSGSLRSIYITWMWLQAYRFTEQDPIPVVEQLGGASRL